MRRVLLQEELVSIRPAEATSRAGLHCHIPEGLREKIGGENSFEHKRDN